MGLDAPTNQVGNHSGSEVKVDQTEGWYLNRNGTKVPVGQTAPFSSPKWRTERSFQGSSRPGDRVACNDYWRLVVLKDTDRPVIQDKYANGGKEYLKWTKHMSSSVGSQILGEHPYISGLVSNLQAACRTEALNKLRDGKVQNGADVGEARTTAQMIDNQGVGLLTLYKELRGLSREQLLIRLGLSGTGRLGKVSKAASNAWLAYQYGWKPLMGSIADNYKLLMTQMRNKGTTFSVSRTMTETFDFEETVGPFKDSYQGTIRVKTGFTAKVSTEWLDRVDTFGFLNPLAVAWELVPFSFVVDWFAPIGNTLESLTARAGLDFRAGYQSTVVELTRTTVQVTPDTAYTIQDQGELILKRFSFYRKGYSDWPIPGFYVDTTPMSPLRAGNAAALLRQLMFK